MNLSEDTELLTINKIYSFQTTFIDTYLYKELVPYLLGKDLINLLLVNKCIYNDPYIKQYINKKSMYIIKLFKKYHTLNSFIQNEFNDLLTNYFRLHRNFLDCILTRKYYAMLYYSYYHRKFRYVWYNEQIGYKKDIIDRYKKKITNEPTKYDLYILIKSMSISESMLIGW